MSLKKLLLDSVPVHLQKEDHFQALLDHVKQHQIEDKEHLADFLKKETNLVETWLKENQDTSITKVKSVRDKVIHLDVLRKCSELTQEFLF